MLAQNDYNDLGQLILKKLHSVNDASYVQDIDYLYDVHGWLKSINNVNDASFRKLYAQDLAYNANGNINTMNWKNTLLDENNNPENPNKQTYSFTYDGLNRLLTAGYSDTDATTQANFSTTYSYYPNGNFHTLTRQGNKNDAQAATPSYGPIDDLTYNYPDFSNQVSSVGDAVTSGVSNPYQYAYNTGSFDYDKNGNATKAPHKQITNINYNYLNLPSQITIAGQNITYLYDASGYKLQKTFGTNNTYYQGSVLKINDNQLIVLTGEGRAVKYGTNNWTYEYDLKDHLGNTRCSFAANGTDVSILQTKDYYPFGLEMGNWYSNDVNATKYLYNGKELQDEGGLDWYDYGARFYDPAIGRWHSVDPHAEKSRRWSPYVYCDDNPLRYIDPDGMDKWSVNLSGKITTGILNFGTNFLGASYSLGGIEKELSFNLSFDDKSFDLKLEVGVTSREVAEKSYSIGGVIGGSESKTRENGYTLGGGINLKTGKLAGDITSKDEKVFKKEETGTIGILTNGQKEGEGEKQVVGIKDGGIGVGVVGAGASLNATREETPEETKKPEEIKKPD